MGLSFDLPISHVLAKLAIGTVCLVAGFSLGSRTARNLDGPTPTQEADKDEEPIKADVEEVSDGDLSAVKAGTFEQCKLVLVVRTDLKMEAGDTSTHAATLACYKALLDKNPDLVKHWERIGQAKIALKGKSDEQLMELEAIAKSLNLCARAVHSEKLAMGKEGTRTVLGIGPAPVDLVNQVTGKLRLF